MLSPRKPPGASPASPRTAVPLNGLFINNTWRCNCPDRPQAIKLQTKNQGANHGRWFWTCQRQKAHCNFFLWSNDAEVREKQVVLNNGRSESFPSPGSGGVGAGGVSTPTKRMSTITNDERGLLTPQTENKTRDFRTPISAQTRTPYSSKSAGAQMMADDEALEQLAGEDGIDSDEGVGSHAAPRSFQDRLNGAGARKYSEAKTESFSSTSSGSPPKTPRTEAITSPGKRKRREQIEDEDAGAGLRTPVKRGPLFSPSPAQSSASSWPKLPPSSAEVCLTPTPTKNPRQSFTVESPSQINTTSLSHEAISLLERQSVVIPRSTQEELVELLDRHELRDKGIVRGRDVTRAALKQRDEEIVKLKEKIAGLERQREMDGAVLRGLRSAGRKSMV